MLSDHITKEEITMFRWYCPQCGESISIWPEFILPYQAEFTETHQQAVVECMNGTTIVETATKLGYDQRTIGRWIKRILNQAITIAPLAITQVLHFMAWSLIPFNSVTAPGILKELLAWLYKYADFIRFTRHNRLIGLCNILGQGRWFLWGAAIGRCKYSRDFLGLSP